MIQAWSAASIRARLTAWYAAVLTVMLLVYASGTFVAVRHEFREQFDEELEQELRNAEGFLSWTPDGRIVVAPDRHHDYARETDRSYEVWSVNGEPLYQSSRSIVFPPAVATTGPDGAFESVEVNQQHWRTLTKAHMLGNRAVVLRAARTEDELRGQLGEILLVLVVGAPFLVALAGAGGYAMARRALAPMDRLASAAQRISAERLHERIDVANPNDEIGRLASIMNEAFARLESSFDRLRRFTADASHELRTPLAVMRGIGEAAAAGPRDAARYAEAIGDMLEETDRMTHLVDTLLRLSHGDAGTIRINRKPIDLGQLTRDVASSLGVLAEERQQKVTVETCAETIVPADRLVLREALTNVVDNAIKYSPAGSTIALRVYGDAHTAAVTVSDQGPGIPAEHRERIFDRFFRVDEGRSRAQGGAGLGLAIAKWAIEVHGGSIRVGDAPAGGAEFRLELPLVPKT